MTALLMIGLSFQLTLPGPEAPIMAMDGGENLYIVRERAERPALPWRIFQGKAKASALPKQTRFIVADRETGWLTAITGSDLIRINPENNDWQRDPRSVRLETTGPWVPAQAIETPGWRGFAFFDTKKLWLVPWESTQDIVTIDSEINPPVPNPDQLAIAWWQPKIMTVQNDQFWMDRKFLTRQRRGVDMDSFQWSVPKVSAMESVAALPLSHNQVHWLHFGGKRGELSTFGWVLKDAKGSVLLREQGIVTGHGLHHTERGIYLFIASVSNSFATHAWLALRGKVRFKLLLLTFESGQWQIVTNRELTLKKAEENMVTEVHWDTDLTGDGVADLLTLDPESGLMVYPVSSKGIAKKGRRLGAPAARLLTLQNQVIRAKEVGANWQIEVLP